MKVGALEGAAHLRRGTLLPSTGHIPELWSGLQVSPVNPQPHPRRCQRGKYTRSGSQTLPSHLRSQIVAVWQAEREQAQKPRSSTQANTPGAVLLAPPAFRQVFLLFLSPHRR